jgi:endonuclease/exonuclease/phosphatase family metal-dependent hydrolase
VVSIVLTVLSYNVHRCVGIDRRCDPPRIARLIQQSRADIVGLQEVDLAFRAERRSHQLDDLAEATGLSAIAGPTIGGIEARFGNALLTRGKINRVEFHDLSVLRREPRGLIDANIGVHGTTVRVLVTHLGLRMNERRRQTQSLLKILSDGAGATDLTLLMGDINEWRPRGFAPYSLDKILGKAPAPRTFPAMFPVFSLDRIWVKPVRALKEIKIPDHELAQVSSDHRPVLAIVDPRKS